jgi:hypothetical protein
MLQFKQFQFQLVFLEQEKNTLAEKNTLSEALQNL